MTHIGQNIKKIRSAKKLSQTDFATIFSLSRGSVGAYEEGRAEPKIDTIIQIANYFGLSIDLLLNKELTVNELFSFNILNEMLNEVHQFNEKPTATYRKGGIGLVEIDKYAEYIVNRSNKDFIANLSYIELPIKLKGTMRAFELNGSEMEYHQNGLHHGDILLCQLSPDFVASVEIGKVYVIVDHKGIIVRRLDLHTQDKLVFISDDPNYKSLTLPIKKIAELWEVSGVFSTYLNPPKMINEKIMLIENRLKKLEDQIGK